MNSIIGARYTSTNTRSERATQGGALVAVSPSLNRTGVMSKKIVKHLLSGVYYEGMKIIIDGEEISDILSIDTLVDVVMKAGLSFASDEFIVPIIAPMIPITDPSVRRFVGPAINAGVSVGGGLLLDRIGTDDMLMEFFYSLGANIAADASIDAVSGILGY